MASPRVLRAANVVDYGFRYADTVQRHPLGMFIDKEVNGVPTGDRFRYVFVGTGGLQSEFGCCYPYKCLAVAVAPTQATGAGVVGSRQVSVTIGASEEPASGLFVANSPYLIGGRVVIGNGANQHPQMRIIVANSATTADGGTMLLTLDEPLDILVTAATTTIEVMMNRYSYVTSGNVTNSGYVTFIGVPAVTCDAGVYAWVQTRGIVWITSNGATCNDAKDRAIFFASNGSVVSTDDIDGVDQLAGYAVDMSGSASSNAPFVLLQME